MITPFFGVRGDVAALDIVNQAGTSNYIAPGQTELARAMVECGWSHRRPNAGFFRLVEGVMGSGAVLRAGGSGAGQLD